MSGHPPLRKPQKKGATVQIWITWRLAGCGQTGPSEPASNIRRSCEDFPGHRPSAALGARVRRPQCFRQQDPKEKRHGPMGAWRKTGPSGREGESASRHGSLVPATHDCRHHHSCGCAFARWKPGRSPARPLFSSGLDIRRACVAADCHCLSFRGRTVPIACLAAYRPDGCTRKGVRPGIRQPAGCTLRPPPHPLPTP